MHSVQTAVSQLSLLTPSLVGNRYGLGVMSDIGDLYGLDSILNQMSRKHLQPCSDLIRDQPCVKNSRHKHVLGIADHTRS